MTASAMLERYKLCQDKATTYSAGRSTDVAPSNSPSSRKVPEITGPCRVQRDSNVTSSPPATLMTSVWTSNGTHSPLTSYSSGLSGFTLSMKRSCVSTAWLVTPHAMRSLWPITTPGTPAKLKPTNWKSHSAVQWSPMGVQIDGIWMGRCGSLARIGMPDSVRPPPMTQLFEPIPSNPPPVRAYTDSARCPASISAGIAAEGISAMASDPASTLWSSGAITGCSGGKGGKS